MGKVLIAGSGGGGGVGSDDVTALKKHVLQGCNTVTKDSNDEIVEGTLPDRGTGGAAISCGLNANGLFYYIPMGYYREDDSRAWVYAPLESIRNVLGLTAAKLLAGQTVCGITGTATNDANLDENWLTVGYSGYDDGDKKNGVLKNNSTKTSNGTVPGVTPSDGSPTRPAASKVLCADQHGTTRFNLRVPEGAYRGSTYINIPGSELGAASASQVLSGVRASSTHGINFAGTLAVQSILSFSAAAYSSAAIRFNWQNPAKGAFSGVIIVGKTGSYPTSINDGTRYYKGHGNATTAHGQASAVVSGFIGGTTYYFKAFSYAVKNNAEWVHAVTRNASATPTIAKGSQTFTASGNWTVPAGVGAVQVFCVGGGGGGREGENATNTGPPYRTGVGGSGGFTTTDRVNVTPGQTISITVGAGGFGSPNTDGGEDHDWGGTKGGFSSFGTFVRADGGEGGSYQPRSDRGYITGGSGGGGHASHWYDSEDEHRPEVRPNGGSDGGNGACGMTTPDKAGMVPNGVGRGQGTTTRAFGESTGTLYSGGGGGGRSVCGCYGGKGGDGGGSSTNNEDGAPNTGGGGHGGENATNDWWHDDYSSSGGSGIVIVRWGY